ncbi:MAG: serine hydrolase [Clostridia bacterium]|nr:serine hydrolase [Clostridia bacterium]
MFEFITPEEAGVSSRRVLEFYDYLERRGLTMHSVLLAKGDALFAEGYWAPFDRDTCHRMYSETKSYVSIAIGLLIGEGKLSLDDRVADYFPDRIHRPLPPRLAEQTVREMLLMKTSCQSPQWFFETEPDRTALYFDKGAATRPSGTYWQYDSPGSQVLCSLVERLSGMSLFDYLNDKIFRHLGTFKTAEILKTPNGDSWGDSALVCTPRDMLSFARLLLNGGQWEGRQLVNEDYVREATSPLVDNDVVGYPAYDNHGYGYQIWRYEQGFGFNGMGTQFTICVPECDMIFVCTADNQGNAAAGELIADAFFDYIVRPAVDHPLPADGEGVAALRTYLAGLTLRATHGATSSPFMKELDGRTYLAENNGTGITEFSFSFGEDGTGVLRYTNAQGKKELPFGLGKNVFTQFPQYGYSDGVGRVPTDNGFTYRAAVSAAFAEERVLRLRVQIIDRYFGNATMYFAFRGKEVAVRMIRTAEAFLGEYTGTFVATLSE